MRVCAFLLLLAFCYVRVESRKAFVPINKNANIDFINMEGGGMRPPPTSAPVPIKPAAPAPAPAPVKPAAPAPAPAPTQPPQAAPVTTLKPVAPTTVKPAPSQAPHLITPKPVNPTPSIHPITTPGPGSVTALVNFYDSQGKGSPIRPYSYSQAVKQG